MVDMIARSLNREFSFLQKHLNLKFITIMCNLAYDFYLLYNKNIEDVDVAIIKEILNVSKRQQYRI
jgi:hypothetical protein